jgi:hypothetical protein
MQPQQTAQAGMLPAKRVALPILLARGDRPPEGHHLRIAVQRFPQRWRRRRSMRFSLSIVATGVRPLDCHEVWPQAVSWLPSRQPAMDLPISAMASPLPPLSQDTARDPSFA